MLKVLRYKSVSHNEKSARQSPRKVIVLDLEKKVVMPQCREIVFKSRAVRSSRKEQWMDHLRSIKVHFVKGLRLRVVREQKSKVTVPKAAVQQAVRVCQWAQQKDNLSSSSGYWFTSKNWENQVDSAEFKSKN